MKIVIFLVIFFFVPAYLFSQDTIVADSYKAIHKVKQNKCGNKITSFYFTQPNGKPYNGYIEQTAGADNPENTGSYHITIKKMDVINGYLHGPVVTTDGWNDTIVLENYKKGVLIKRVQYCRVSYGQRSETEDNVPAWEEDFDKKGALVKKTYYRTNTLHQVHSVSYFKKCHIYKEIDYRYDGDKFIGYSRVIL